MSEDVLIQSKELFEICIRILTRTGLQVNDAFTVAESLIFANLRGIDSHGVMRLPVYVLRLEKGGTKIHPNIKIIRERTATALIDGDSGMGQVVGKYATELALKKARDSGIGFVGVKGSGHYGAASYYTVKMAQEGMVGITTSNTTQNTAAWGGTTKIIGNDPLSIAVPYKEDNHLVLDISMSKVSGGKIKLAAKNNQKIPFEWGLDKYGKKTDNPNEIINGGTRLPFGEHKGYGLTVMMEILNGVLTGAGMLSQIISWSKHLEEPTNLGHCFLAIDIESFMDKIEFQKRLDLFVNEIKTSPPMEGLETVFLPGEIEAAIEKERKERGIPISLRTWNEMLILAGKYGKHI